MTASADVVDDLRERLEVDGLPWLVASDTPTHAPGTNRFGTREQILREFEGLDMSPWSNTPRVINAIIRAARGDMASARVLLRDQARDAAVRNPLHSDHVRRLAVRLGLGPLDE